MRPVPTPAPGPDPLAGGTRNRPGRHPRPRSCLAVIPTIVPTAVILTVALTVGFAVEG